MGFSQFRCNDPEFLDSFHKAVWIDQNKKIWVGNINPNTGLFYSVHGQDILIDSNVVPIDSALINGPEWGTNASDTVVFYTKRDAAGKRGASLADFITESERTINEERKTQHFAKLKELQTDTHFDSFAAPLI